MTTVEDLQQQLTEAIEDTLADMGDDAPDEGSVAAELFASMSYDWEPRLAAEVARREFGFVPGGSAQAVADAFSEDNPEWEF